jgi:hypothetical protein
VLTKQAADRLCDFLAGVSLQASLQKQAFSLTPTTGAAIGAGAGGLLGLMGEMRKKKRDRKYLNSLLAGTLAGGGLGLGAGLIPQAWNAMRNPTVTPEPPAPSAGKTQPVANNQPPATLQRPSTLNNQTPAAGSQLPDENKQLPGNAPWGQYAGSNQMAADLSRAGYGAAAGVMMPDPLRLAQKGYVAGRRGVSSIYDRSSMLLRPENTVTKALQRMYITAPKSNLVGTMGGDSPLTQTVNKQQQRMVGGVPQYEEGPLKMQPVTDSAGNPQYHQRTGKIIEEPVPVYDDSGKPIPNTFERLRGAPIMDTVPVSEKIPYSKLVQDIANDPKLYKQFVNQRINTGDPYAGVWKNLVTPEKLQALNAIKGHVGEQQLAARRQAYDTGMKNISESKATMGPVRRGLTGAGAAVGVPYLFNRLYKAVAGD